MTNRYRSPLFDTAHSSIHRKRVPRWEEGTYSRLDEEKKRKILHLSVDLQKTSSMDCVRVASPA